MKVVVLAGGYGTRISEETAQRPKPMVEIGERPILYHVMCHYPAFGFTDFYIGCGYRLPLSAFGTEQPDVSLSTRVPLRPSDAAQVAG